MTFRFTNLQRVRHGLWGCVILAKWGLLLWSLVVAVQQSRWGYAVVGGIALSFIIVLDIGSFIGHRRRNRNRRNTSALFSAYSLAIARRATLTGTSTFQGTSPRIIKTRQDDLPILAAKWARFERRVDTGEYVFLPLNGGYYPGDLHHLRAYGVSEYAVCNRGGDHRVPTQGCSCGFYARPIDLLEWHGDSAGLVRLQVELSGRVIVGSHGYRAEHQRVLSIEIPPICGRCSGLTFRLFQVRLAPERTVNFATPTPEMNDYLAIIALCDGCARPFVQHSTRTTVDEVSHGLGIPVMWGDPTEIHQVGS